MKYEEVYLKAYQDGREARIGLGNYFPFYNTERPHQALGYRTPAKVFTSTPVEATSTGMVESLTPDPLRIAVPALMSCPKDGLDLSIAEVNNRTKALKTPPTLPPNSLINWARKELIVPVTLYDSASHFYQEVTFALQSIPDKAATANIYNVFWDITYKCLQEIAPRKPKKEPDIVSIIHGLLCDVATAKNFEITPQYPLGEGELDFLISGRLKTGEVVNVCVEFKHAHSRKLRDGLLKQLPTYTKNRGCDFGIYCVTFFKGTYFEEPKKYTIETLNSYLDSLWGPAELSNIRILVY